MSLYHLAEVNVAHWKVHPDSPEAADFINNLNRVNLLAENSPGFVWRLLDDSDTPFGDDHIVTMSIWETSRHLKDFVYRSYHKTVFGRRDEWFHEMSVPSMALWWVPAGHQPDLAEAEAKLALLLREGPSSEAFGFANIFPAPDAMQAAAAAGG